LILDAVVVSKFNGLVAKSVHSLVDHLSVVLVTTVNVHLVLSCTSQPAFTAFTLCTLIITAMLSQGNRAMSL